MRRGQPGCVSSMARQAGRGGAADMAAGALPTRLPPCWCPSSAQMQARQRGEGAQGSVGAMGRVCQGCNQRGRAALKAAAEAPPCTHQVADV